MLPLPRAFPQHCQLHACPAPPPSPHPPPSPMLPPPCVAMQSKDKTLRLINSFWHILVREPGNEKINAAIADWLLERAK